MYLIERIVFERCNEAFPNAATARGFANSLRPVGAVSERLDPTVDPVARARPVRRSLLVAKPISFR